jgi:hypothetical protein
MLLPWGKITRRKLCFYFTCKFVVISIKYVIILKNGKMRKKTITQRKKESTKNSFKKQIKIKHAKQNSLELFLMANFDRVNRPIDMSLERTPI